MDTLENLEWILLDRYQQTDGHPLFLFNSRGNDVSEQTDSVTSKFEILFPKRKTRCIVDSNINSRHRPQIFYQEQHNGVMTTVQSMLVDGSNSLLLFNRAHVLYHSSSEKSNSTSLITHDNDKLVITSSSSQADIPDQQTTTYRLNGTILKMTVVDSTLICLHSGVLSFVCLTSLIEQQKLKLIDPPTTMRLPNNVITYSNARNSSTDGSLVNFSLLTQSGRYISFILKLMGSGQQHSSNQPSLSKWPKYTTLLISMRERHQRVVKQIECADKSLMDINRLITMLSRKPFAQASKRPFSCRITPLVSPLISVQSGAPSSFFRFTVTNHTNHEFDSGWKLSIRYVHSDFPLEYTTTLSHPIHLHANSSTSFELPINFTLINKITFTVFLTMVLRNDTSSTTTTACSTNNTCCLFIDEKTFHMLDHVKFKPVAQQVEGAAVPSSPSNHHHHSFGNTMTTLETLFKMLMMGSGPSMADNDGLAQSNTQHLKLSFPIRSYQMLSKPDINQLLHIFNFVFDRDIATIYPQQKDQTSNSLELFIPSVMSNNNKNTTKLSVNNVSGKSYSVHITTQASVPRETKHLIYQSILLRSIYGENLPINEDQLNADIIFFKEKIKVIVAKKVSLKKWISDWYASKLFSSDCATLELSSIPALIDQNFQTLQKIQESFESLVII
ncbi:hypothetical protein SAMD00019534_006710 [Acytostelium subglobosum LB1]|uniref:hypothetical protein n=1 Tax=Acytostelium subglobosum LB1 TaxID=1410327 RepID=UPI0006449686|nr:hypothetical protein SAMD00019534_006710 [Acytostelium subglobosum LB1]GAM17496.1 hypothetical protein SAMD00019534_006710 [Acytostelium subglobosum LB1]|eukprot:XP_012759558.1 hypothetical protein SAMD00019534_006710 [Acytostelium subglobosum LB1]